MKKGRSEQPMRQLEEIEKEEIRDLLNAGWMTHDAMWFSHCVAEFGIEQTNRINRAAVRSMAAVEAKRIKKLLGMRTVESYDEIRHFVTTGFGLIRGSFMRFEFDFPGDNLFVWKVPRCFAHDGVKRLGHIDRYECGIVERIIGWFEALGIGYSIDPAPNGCLMHRQGKCEMVIRLHLEAAV